MLVAVVPGRIFHPSRCCHPSVYAKSLTKPELVAAGGVGAVVDPKSWSFAAAYPSPGSAPGMKYAYGCFGSMGKTGTACPLPSGLVSLPARPSNGCPVVGDLFLVP